MNNEKALEIMKAYQRWRKGDIDEIPYTSKEISEAIDVAIKALKNSVI